VVCIAGLRIFVLALLALARGRASRGDSETESDGFGGTGAAEAAGAAGRPSALGSGGSGRSEGAGRERRRGGTDFDNNEKILFVGVPAGIRSFADGNELMDIMATSKQVHTCYSKNVAAYALGRDVVERDRPLLESLANVSRSESLKKLILALVRDPAFRVREEGLP
jgi:hypothetical protein